MLWYLKQREEDISNGQLYVHPHHDAACACAPRMMWNHMGIIKSRPWVGAYAPSANYQNCQGRTRTHQWTEFYPIVSAYLSDTVGTMLTWHCSDLGPKEGEQQDSWDYPYANSSELHSFVL